VNPAHSATARLRCFQDTHRYSNAPLRLWTEIGDPPARIAPTSSFPRSPTVFPFHVLLS
jgi:hypothetical protein